MVPHTFRTEHSETHTTNAEYGEYYAHEISRKIPVRPKLQDVMRYIDSHVKDFLSDLAQAVGIKSVSGDLKYRNEVISMIKFVEKWLIKLEIKYECFYIGYHKLGGNKVRRPPIILATCGNDPEKKTVCVYGHLDVKKPVKSRWETDPWKLTLNNKRYYGCGTASGKGPMLCWFHAIQAFKETGHALPMNVKFIIESMNHQMSEGMAAFIQTRKLDFFPMVNYVVSCDSEWIGEKYPCIIYGTVGILHFELTVEQNGSSNIKEDMAKLVSEVYDPVTEKILIPNFNDFVKQITPDEEKVYENIRDFDPEDVREALPPFKQGWDKVKLLMHFWRLPSMLVSEDSECICEINETTKIKRQLVIKLVPKQVVATATKQVEKFIEEAALLLGLKSIVTCKLISATRPWHENIRSANYRAAQRATIQVYKESPSFIREDRDRRSIDVLDTTVEKNILFLPLASKGSNPAGDNENISYRNYMEGTKLIAAYLIQLSNIDDP